MDNINDIKLSDIDLFKVYSKWKNSLKAFECFFRAANFVSLKHYPDFELEKVPESGGEYFDIIAGRLADYSLQDTFFILDINGTDAIRTAFFLRKEFLLAPILVFNGVLHPFGLLGDRKYINYLLGYGLLNKDINKMGYILVLDLNRYREYSDLELKENFNNQYELGEEDFPSVEMLEQFGYKKVVYFYDQIEKEDIACYLDYLSQGGVELTKIDLAKV